MSYAHLSQDERYQIQHLHHDNFSPGAIGKRIGRAASTVRRELRRNADAQGYRAVHAHRRSVHRRQVASSRQRIDASVWPIVHAFLAKKLSPVQIIGVAAVRISHERIYQHIAADRKTGGLLWTQLRCRKRRRRRCGTPRQRQRFRGRRIVERPARVHLRTRVGDWEGDSIVGQGNTRIITLVERKTGFVRLRRVANGEAARTIEAVVDALYPIRQRVHTLTWDNGSEFAGHAIIDIILGARSYFADPYSAWQRGCNENLNGLLRQYFPKGCDLSAFSDERIQQVEDELNQRPRKRLRFRTPEHQFEKSLNRGALRT